MTASMILFVIKEFIIMNSNVKEITKRIKIKYNYDINYVTLTKVLLNIRKTIADYFKHIYRIERIARILQQKV